MAMEGGTQRESDGHQYLLANEKLQKPKYKQKKDKARRWLPINDGGARVATHGVVEQVCQVVEKRERG